MKVLLGIPTYRRNEELLRLLRSLVVQLPPDFFILVVDNSGNAENVVQSIRSSKLGYRYEPILGVVAVRNVILRFADENGYEGVAFIDDDMEVPNDWCLQLRQAVVRYPGAVLAGHVEYHTEVAVDDPFVQSWVSRRAPGSDGEKLSSSGTGNVFVPMVEWRKAGRPMFDKRFAHVGGEDAHLFELLVQEGVVIRRVPNLVVREIVPQSRATRRWIRRRLMREGQARAIMFGGRGKWVYITGAGKVLVGVCQVAWACILRRRDYKNEARFWNGIGAIYYQVRGVMAEYGKG